MTNIMKPQPRALFKHGSATEISGHSLTCLKASRARSTVVPYRNNHLLLSERVSAATARGQKATKALHLALHKRDSAAAKQGFCSRVGSKVESKPYRCDRCHSKPLEIDSAATLRRQKATKGLHVALQKAIQRHPARCGIRREPLPFDDCVGAAGDEDSAS